MFLFAVLPDEESAQDLGVDEFLVVYINSKESWEKTGCLDDLTEEEVDQLEDIFNRHNICPAEIMENIYEYHGSLSIEELTEALANEPLMEKDDTFIAAMTEMSEE